jgi:two-component sensor histidine kinase
MIFDQLINLGVTNELEFYRKRETRIVNLYSLITIFGLITGISTVFFISGTYPTRIVTFTAITSVLILFFNSKQKYDLATYFFVIPLNINIFVINQQHYVSDGSVLYYFPLIFSMALLHNPLLPNRRTVFFFILILINFVIAQTTNIEYLKLPLLSNKDNHFVFNFNSYLTVFLTLALVYLVVRLLNKQNKETIQLLTFQQESQEKIAQSLKEKDVLLAEIQHRVKNNLAVITGLLNLQTEKAPCEVSRQLMLESSKRVMSIAMVHNSLYKKNNLSEINLKNYLSELAQELAYSIPLPSGNSLFIDEHLEDTTIGITKAVPIGLILNEAITNALKHGFKSSKNPELKIELVNSDPLISITISDNGPGFPKVIDFDESSLGVSLMESLAEQIDATFNYGSKHGAWITLTFSK